jgi:hypothetical protein
VAHLRISHFEFGIQNGFFYLFIMKILKLFTISDIIIVYFVKGIFSIVKGF